MRRGRERGRRVLGFTLLEVMIALAIFSIGLLALVPLFATAQWGTRGGRELSEATNLARSYVDRLRNTPFGNLGPCAGSVVDPNAQCVPPAAEQAANAPFVVAWTITAPDGTVYQYVPPALAPPSPNMKRITVTVTCATCARQNLTVQMTTIVAERS